MRCNCFYPPEECNCGCSPRLFSQSGAVVESYGRSGEQGGGNLHMEVLMRNVIETALGIGLGITLGTLGYILVQVVVTRLMFGY